MGEVAEIGEDLGPVKGAEIGCAGVGRGGGGEGAEGESHEAVGGVEGCDVEEVRGSGIGRCY